MPRNPSTSEDQSRDTVSQRQVPGENQENKFPEIALLSSPNYSPEIFTD